MSKLTYSTNQDDISEYIAIIGMAGRFPEAKNIREFWQNIVDGKECIRFFTDEELRDAGISQEELSDPRYVRGKGFLENAEDFDAAFFGINAPDADILDPQQRLFLECAWEAFEDAGYIPETIDGLVGVFAGVGIDFYLMKNLLMNSGIPAKYSDFQVIISNDKDYLATRLSYKLNLRGPSIVVQSACSTFMVAVQLACQNLLTYQCDMALSGASFLQIPRITGYTFREGHILSPDGHCRAFDKDAGGTNFGDGVGTVILKRLEDAIEDRDHIYAVITGIAANNDGADKIGYSAPSISGQSQVISLAQSFAGTSPDTISYVETHGTGTPLGDPIELAGLKEAFGKTSRPGKYCAIGSVKSNIGHLDVAAGSAGLIKTALSLYHKTIPESINYTAPNPELKIEESPFFVNTETRDWEPLLDETGNPVPRRAGLSSFGMGGTNVHAVLEEIEQPEHTQSDRPAYILPLSAMTGESLDVYTKKLERYFQDTTDISLADLSYTLFKGRKKFDVRRYVVCGDIESAIQRLKDTPPVVTGGATASGDTVNPVLMFSGQGSQYVGMGKQLYETHPVFRKEIDTCADLISQLRSFDIRTIMFEERENGEPSLLYQTQYTQLALFTIEYALAKTWLSLGIRPAALIGHSIGEYAAACIAGVFSLEDAVKLVCHRGELMQKMHPGSMLAVRLPEKELIPYLNESVTIAVINTDAMCVASGPDEAISELEQRLKADDVSSRKLHTSHAFHSAMMDPMLDEFEKIAGTVAFSSPAIPFISNVSGTWITPEEAQNPHYWSTQVRNTVRYADGVRTMLEAGNTVFLEAGPGNTLATLTRQQAAALSFKSVAVTSLPHPKQDYHDYAMWLSAVGKLWAENVEATWSALFDDVKPRRIPLPTYAFMPERHWIEPDSRITAQGTRTLRKEGSDTVGQTVEDTTAVELPLKEQIREVWKDILGVDTVGDSDDFFDLGGDSIWASQLVNRLNDRFRISLPLNTIFQASTVNTLSEYLETQVAEEEQISSAAEDTEISVEERNQVSLPQQRLWFLSTFAPESPAFNLAVSFELTGELDIEILKASITDIINRHEILRTRYLNKDGSPEIIIDPSVEFDFETKSVEHLEDNAVNKAITEVIREKNIIPYNLVTGPVLRFILFRLSDSEHVLVLMVHHIAFDGWSLGVFLSDLGKFYAARLSGSSPDIAPLEVQYPDFAAWQQTEFLRRDMSADRDYWRERLKDAPSVLNLPFDLSRPPMPANTGGMIDFILNPELTSKLKTICTQKHITMFTLLQTAFKVLLYRYSGQADILVGSPIANRTRSVDEKLIGLFINMIVLRSDLEGNPDFIDLLKTEQSNVLEAFKHSEYPFERILDDLNITRDISIHPIYQVMFAYQNFAIPIVKAGSLSMRNIVHARGASQLDLWLFMYEEENSIRGAFEYDDELFTQSTIRLMSSHFIMLLESIANNPTQPILSIPLMDDDERNTIISKWNATDRSYHGQKTIIDFIDNSVRSYPDNIAVRFKNETVTYKELDQKSSLLAGVLQRKGVGPETLVGIFLDRSIEIIIAIIGILKSGGAYLPLDPEFPADRLSFMAEDANLGIIISRGNQGKSLAPADCEVLDIETVMNSGTSDLSAGQPQKISQDTIAYILYTSGSTGKPKGVQISHGALLNFLLSMQRQPGFSQSDNLLAVTTFSFDISNLEIHLPLISGGQITLASRDDTRDGKMLSQYLQNDGITVMQATPVTWRMIIESGHPSFKGLKVLCGGEALSKDLAADILKRDGNLWNLYGPTETTIWSSIQHITSAEMQPSIGRPIDNTRFFILDTFMNPSPIGIPGELYIAGDGLARGYLNRPELTNEKFIHYTIPGFPEQRLYKTGDLARWLPDGTVEYIARTDSQIKIRGFRIELGEIETLLNEHPAVRQAAVVIKEFENKNKMLVAFYECRKSPCDEENLKKSLQNKLPDYMVPSSFFEMEKLPLTANEKIDRKALTQINLATSSHKENKVTYLNETEIQLKTLWEQVLGIKNISVNDNFFDIGGDSLIAARLFALITKRLGLTIPLATLFRYPTIAGIADYIKSGGISSHWKSLVPIRPQGEKPALFLIHGAEGNVLIYRELGKYIPTDFPIYGLQSPGLVDQTITFKSLEELAELYITEIKSVQPEGPYYLGGYCLGGVLALEMAQQLQQKGEQLGPLFFLETYNVKTITYPPPLSERVIIELQNVWFHFKSLAIATQKNSGWIFLHTKALTQLKRAGSRTHMLFSQLFERTDNGGLKSYPHIAVTNANHEAQINYNPSIYEGSVVLFRPKTYYKGSEDPHYGWKDVVKGNLLVHVLNAYPHTSLTEPYVAELGEYIAKYLNDSF